MVRKKLAIILPCYNQQEGWRENIVNNVRELSKKLSDLDISVTLVNDGSKKEITESDVRFLDDNIAHFYFITYTQNRGKGYALRKGMEASTADYYVYTDLDFPYNNASFITLCKELQKEENDIVAGIKNKNYYKTVPPFRKRVSVFLRWLTRTFLAMPNADTQCGLKGFNQKGKTLFLDTTIERYLFDLEFLFFAARDKEVKTLFLEIDLRENIIFSQLNFSILLGESLNFISILFQRFIK